MNKMFKKLMAVTATLAIAATMSVSAFAADVTVAPTDDKVSVTPATAENATMYTVMVFSCAADADKATAVPADASAIYYINQGTDVNALVTDMLVKATSETEYLPAGNYVVRIGNDTGSVQNFTLESKVAETGGVVIDMWGDVDGDNEIGVGDMNAIVARILGTSQTFGDYSVGVEIPGTDVLWGDVDGDGEIGVGDMNAIVARILGTAQTFGDYTVGSPATIPTK